MQEFIKNLLDRNVDVKTASAVLVIVFGLVTVFSYFSFIGASPVGASSKKAINTAGVEPTNLYEGYMNETLFMHNTDSTRDQAYQNCLLNASVHVGTSIRCTWGNEEIYALGATDKRDKCNKSVDKSSKKSDGVLSGSILLGTCKDLPSVITDVEFIDLLTSYIKSGSEPNPLYVYGWTVQMLLDSYPGLLQSDFSSVEAIPVPDAPADAITSDGFRTLARNVSVRFSIPLDSSTAVDAIMTKIETAP